jgi:hypothetical protein
MANDRKREQIKARKLALETGMNRKARRHERFAVLKTPVEPVVTDELKAKAKAKKKAKEAADTSAV